MSFGLVATRPNSLTCPKLHAPIVMAHGLFGFRRIGFGPVTVAWYFRDIPDIIRSGGNRVLVTRVHPTAGVVRRGKRLGEQIIEAFPDEPIHILAHSMGGLDARALLNDPAWHGRILSLTTVATPHLGSGIADFAKLRAGRIYSLLDRLGVDHHGFLDLTRSAVTEFNRRTPVPRSIPIFTVAGDPAAAEISWPLRRLHAALTELEGPNDGLVSVESATAIGEPLRNWPVDHLRQVNWLSNKVAGGPGPRTARLYLDLIENLADLESATGLTNRPWSRSG